MKKHNLGIFKLLMLWPRICYINNYFFPPVTCFYFQCIGHASKLAIEGIVILYTGFSLWILNTSMSNYRLDCTNVVFVTDTRRSTMVSATSQNMMEVVNLDSLCYGDQPPAYFPCNGCGNTYRHKRSLQKHVKLECGKEPQFHCPYCPVRMKQKGNLLKHIRKRHALLQ
jgi:hypothetical protein